ncbi:MAG TPA: CNNM domain-containing protein [bacterium]|nr:CNNM domain-containing protein [bacterium]
MGTLLVLILLLAVSAAFSGFETALFSISPMQRYRLKEAGGVASFVHRILEKPREILTTILFGNELINVGISILAGGLAYDVLTRVPVRTAFIISTIVTTIVILIFGEILPKNFAIRMPVLVSQVLVVPYQIFAWVVWPFRVVFTKISDGIVMLLGGDPKKGRRLIVEEELRSLVEHGKAQGTLAELERSLIHNALDFSGQKLFKVMTQRENIVAVAVDTRLPEILKTIRNKRFSRIPVYEGNVNQIVGILHAKELLKLRSNGRGGHQLSIRDLLKPHMDVSPEETLDHVFQKFQHYRVHMGIVKDKTQKVIGLITMDDLLRKFFPQSL